MSKMEKSLGNLSEDKEWARNSPKSYWVKGASFYGDRGSTLATLARLVALLGISSILSNKLHLSFPKVYDN